jgi:antitoxin ParD1/3/4
MPTRNVNLTEHLDRFVDRQVSSGRYSNASEIVREALRWPNRQDENRIHRCSPGSYPLLYIFLTSPIWL